eukprot:2464599-Prymnesium_polylepis.1
MLATHLLAVAPCPAAPSAASHCRLVDVAGGQASPGRGRQGQVEAARADGQVSFAAAPARLGHPLQWLPVLESA